MHGSGAGEQWMPGGAVEEMELTACGIADQWGQAGRVSGTALGSWLGEWIAGVSRSPGQPGV